MFTLKGLLSWPFCAWDQLKCATKLEESDLWLFYYRFKNFSLLLEELYNRQTQWTIPDTELREAVRLAVAEVLLPAYRSFIKRYRYLSF